MMCCSVVKVNKHTHKKKNQLLNGESIMTVNNAAAAAAAMAASRYQSSAATRHADADSHGRCTPSPPACQCG